MVFIALPSAFVQRTLKTLQGMVLPGTFLVNMAKGIEQSTGLTSFQMFDTLFPASRAVMLSGPSVANEFARKMPTTLQAILYIAEKLHISLPLAKGLWDVINGRYAADRFITMFIRDFVE